MSYQLELSINLNKVTNLSELKNIIIEKGYQCKLEDHYTMYEYVGKNRQTFRNHCIITFLFMEHDELLAEFIRYIKKIKNVKIESLGVEKGMFKLMYASKKYLNLMEKDMAKRYLLSRKEKTLYKQDSIIYKAIYKN